MTKCCFNKTSRMLHIILKCWFLFPAHLWKKANMLLFFKFHYFVWKKVSIIMAKNFRSIKTKIYNCIAGQDLCIVVGLTCAYACDNSTGTWTCICPSGFQLGSDGSSCVGKHYINITFFTGWHDRLSSRGNIVYRGGAEVDNAFRGVTIYHLIP